jgi:hypothetical protein
MYTGKLAPLPQHATKMYRWSVGTARSMPDAGSVDKYVTKAPCYCGLGKTALDIDTIQSGPDNCTSRGGDHEKLCPATVGHAVMCLGDG